MNWYFEFFFYINLNHVTALLNRELTKRNIELYGLILFFTVNKLLLNAQSYSDHNSTTEANRSQKHWQRMYSASFLWFRIYREIPVTDSHTMLSFSSVFALYNVTFFLKATFESRWFAPRLHLSFHNFRDRSPIICCGNRICNKVDECVQYTYIHIHI